MLTRSSERIFNPSRYTGSQESAGHPSRLPTLFINKLYVDRFQLLPTHLTSTISINFSNLIRIRLELFNMVKHTKLSSTLVPSPLSNSTKRWLSLCYPILSVQPTLLVQHNFLFLLLRQNKDPPSLLHFPCHIQLLRVHIPLIQSTFKHKNLIRSTFSLHHGLLFRFQRSSLIEIFTAHASNVS